MCENISVNAAACAAAASDPTLLATDLADYLVRKGMPFREAHHIVGAVVAFAEKNGKPLNELSVAELRAIDQQFGDDAHDVFDLSAAMQRRKLTGAPGTNEVRKQLVRWRKSLA
jgi:argininosuccinate lyase